MLELVHQCHVLWGKCSGNRLLCFSILVLKNLIGGGHSIDMFWFRAHLFVVFWKVEHSRTHTLRLPLFINYLLNSIPFDLSLMFFFLVNILEALYSHVTITLGCLTRERFDRAGPCNLFDHRSVLVADMCLHDYNFLLFIIMSPIGK